ncbi:GNAT family N-acetyltransferase [Paenibacillus kribbensis]|uniref:GNAT family N-acetyltransferase n=1 Tax=Paenibacillus kribbensis TaxID=172713 RepID=UPI0015C05760|nr:GNAT family N-acetyltransferase [Paenibacillus kribbensis]
MEIVKYRDSDYESLVAFMRINWSPEHAIYNKELFDWQYRIDENGLSESLLLIDNGCIEGFLGVIPGEYSSNGEQYKGISFAMWIVSEKYRNSGLGIMLMKEAEKYNSVCLTLGCNFQVVPMYERMGYSYSDHLNRYVIPLDVNGYVNLLKDPVNQAGIEQWLSDVEERLIRSYSPVPNITGEKLEQLYITSIQRRFSLSQYRSASFWEWRYINSAGYKYLFFGDPAVEGIVVARLDRAYAPEESVHGTKVLRIIEIIPANADVWEGAFDHGLIEMVHGVLSWARSQGCVAADYQLSSNRLEHILESIGFKKQNIDYTPEECGLAGLFQPFRYRVNPINFVWKMKSNEDGFKNMEVNDIYLVKTDGDMDRPNIWPLPKGWN